MEYGIEERTKLTWKKEAIILLVVTLLLAIVTTPVLAVSFESTLLVTNNTTTSYPMLGLLHANNTTYQITNGFISANATDVQILSSGSPVPRMLAEDRIAFAAPVAALSSSGYTLTTENSPEDFDIITGNGGHITTADAPNLEMSGNFTKEISAYFDTSASAVGANWTEKYDATLGGYRGWNSGTGNLTFAIWQADITDNLLPDSAGDYTNLPTIFGVVNHWDAVNDPVGAPDDDATYVACDAVGAQQKDAYNITASLATLDTNTIINSVTVYYRFRSNGGGNGWAQPFLRLGAAETTGTEVLNNTGAYVNVNEALARPGGGTWVATDLASLQVAIGLKGGAGITARCTQIYVVVSYQSAVSVTASGVSSGEHTANVSYVKNSVLNSSFENSDPPANWAFGGAGATWVRSNAQIKFGSYSGLLTRNGANCLIEQSLADFLDYAGQPTIYGMYVYCTTPNVFRILYDDGVAQHASSYNTGVAAWELLTATLIVDAVPTHLTLDAVIENSDVSAYVDGAILISGTTLPNGYYNFNLSIDGVITGQTAVDGGVTVPDNANNIIEFPSTVNPYVEYSKLYVGGVLQQHLQPQVYISSSIIPDRATDATSNPATITWGSNPAGISITGSAMVFTESSSTAGELTTPDAVSRVGNTTDIHQEDFDLRAPAHEFYPIISDVATLSNITIEMIWWFISALCVLAALTGARKLISSVMIAGFAATIVMGYFVSQGVLEWWMPAGMILATISSMVTNKILSF